MDGRWTDISIHALREEGDQDTETGEIYKGDFYPRPPRGGRPIRHRFVLTHSKISIHALREEGDRMSFWFCVSR